ncbi:MAG TPA: hypothetical protein VHC22_14610 [Pirellulales bacterium]|nr:hypothetical protein [Pirellulales bacterium]
MKTSCTLVAGMLLASAVCGCQKTTAPAPQGSGSASATATAPSANAGDRATSAEMSTDADQPADPGRTTAHDKTLKQEQPSGDESSQAAPNEGDAEPPQ